MGDTFKAIQVSRDAEKNQSVDIVELRDEDLMEGDVTVAVEATTVNYKDGLAITGKARRSSGTGRWCPELTWRAVLSNRRAMRSSPVTRFF